MQDFKNNQPYQDNELEEAEMPLEEHEEALLPEFGDGSFEAENEEPLIPCRINEAENSTAKVILYPPSVEYLMQHLWRQKKVRKKPIMIVLFFFLQIYRQTAPAFLKVISIIVVGNFNKSKNIKYFLIKASEKIKGNSAQVISLN